MRISSVSVTPNTVNGTTFQSLLTRIQDLETALANKQDKIESWSDLKG